MARRAGGPRDLRENLEPVRGLGSVVTVERRGRRLENDRRRITWVLLALNAVLTLALIAFSVALPEQSWARVDRNLALLLSPWNTLLGIAVGYYFADTRSRGRR